MTHASKHQQSVNDVHLKR